MTESDRPMSTLPQPPSTEPLRASLSCADDRLRLNHWIAPQQGIAPRIRIGRRWINALWGLPIGAAALLCLIAFAQSLRELPDVAAFIRAASRHRAVRAVGRTRASHGGCSSSTS